MIGLSLGVRESGGPRIFVPSCSRQAIGFGLITPVDLTLMGQIPMLPVPRIRCVAHIDRPSRTSNVDRRFTLKA
jgi:hypothetical protein